MNDSFLIKRYFFIANNETSVLFLMGQDPSLDEDEKSWLLEEQMNNDDIIEVGGLIEHYNNLTLKTLYTIKFFLEEGELYNLFPKL